jgi:hypothetical protein
LGTPAAVSAPLAAEGLADSEDGRLYRELLAPEIAGALRLSSGYGSG